MLRIGIISLFVLTMACSDSTGPSYIDYSKVSILDTVTGEISTEIDFGNAGISRMCISPDGSYLYIIQLWSGNDVVQFDCQTQSVTGGIDFGTGDLCLDVCLNDQGSELYVNYDGAIYIIDVPSLSVRDSVCSGIAGAGRIVHRPGTDLLYSEYYNSNHGIYVIDVAQCEVVDTLDYWASNLVFSESGNDLYVAEGTVIRRLDPDLGHQLASYNVNAGITDICLNSSSTTVFASWSSQNTDQGGVISLDYYSLLFQDSVDTEYHTGFLCYVPVRDNLYAGIHYYLAGDGVICFDLPDLNTVHQISISEGLQDMVADPSGDYVYCSIEYGVDN